MGAFEPLICPNCGADIDVPEGATVMRCSYCSSKLQLKDSGSVRALVLMGEKLDKVVEHTQRTAEGVALIHQHAARTADGVERLQEQLVSARDEPWERWNERMDDLSLQLTRITNTFNVAEAQLYSHAKAARKFGTWGHTVLWLGGAILGAFWLLFLDYARSQPVGHSSNASITDSLATLKLSLVVLSLSLLILTFWLFRARRRNQLKATQWSNTRATAGSNADAAAYEYENWRVREPL